MQTNYLLFLSLLTLGFLTNCSQDEDLSNPATPEFSYDFTTDTEGWVGGFADYPVGEEEFYALSVGFARLPAPLDGSSGSIRQSGNNHSDDLFMYIKRKLTGLTPNRTYRANVDLRIATDAADNSFGIGGSPGSSVYVKAGLATEEPLAQADSTGFYLMNIDKGDQSQSGRDMAVIGNLANGSDESVYALKTVGNSVPFEIQADANGEAWVIIGTDSGFEGTTTIHYDHIGILLQ